MYVEDFPAAIGKWRISTAGGDEPKWRHDGKELFYLALDGKLMAVPIKLGMTTIAAGVPVPLFQTRIEGAGGAADIFHQDHVSADGQRFLVNDLEESAPAPPVTVVVNWQGRAEAKVAGGLVRVTEAPRADELTGS